MPKGYPENAARCIAEVPYGGRSVLFHQCDRKRGKGPQGLYCAQHTKMLDNGIKLYVPDEES